jgi:hypothetical protein
VQVCAPLPLPERACERGAPGVRFSALPGGGRLFARAVPAQRWNAGARPAVALSVSRALGGSVTPRSPGRAGQLPCAPPAAARACRLSHMQRGAGPLSQRAASRPRGTERKVPAAPYHAEASTARGRARGRLGAPTGRPVACRKRTARGSLQVQRPPTGADLSATGLGGPPPGRRMAPLAYSAGTTVSPASLQAASPPSKWWMAL